MDVDSTLKRPPTIVRSVRHARNLTEVDGMEWTEVRGSPQPEVRTCPVASHGGGPLDTYGAPCESSEQWAQSVAAGGTQLPWPERRASQ